MKTIIEMALEADIDAEAEGLTQALERFAALVREDERSLQHKIDYDQGFVDGVEEGRAMREREKQQEPVAWLDPKNGEVCRAEWLAKHARECDQDRYSVPLYTTPPTIEAAVLAEREACAVVAENVSTADAYLIAHNIRARSE